MAAVSTIPASRGPESSHAHTGVAGETWQPHTADDQELDLDSNELGRDAIPIYESGGSSQAYSSNTRANRGDQAYLLPYKQGSRPNLNSSRSGSEPDSLIDLYGHPRSIAERSLDGGRQKADSAGHEDGAQAPNDQEPEQSHWIHRDKLAIIESREMQAAGIVPPAPQPSIRSRHRREKSADRQIVGEELSDGPVLRNGKKRKVKTTSADGAEEEAPLNDFDVRTPEEIAADVTTERSSSPIYRSQTPRSSSSRIPLPKSSPMPMPTEHLERTTRLPRKRNASGTWSGVDEEGISYQHLRSRGNSVGSQVLLDDNEGTQSFDNDSRPTSSGSPIKRLGNANKTSHIRKASLSSPNSNQKPRAASGAKTPTPQRPKSRSGLEPRPPTAINRPDGDAPWLKDMYKPDPMLPPDQQLLPTHAKRLQEEQRRKEQWQQAAKDSDLRRKQRTEDTPQQDMNAAESPPPGLSPLAMHTHSGLKPSPSSTHESQPPKDETDSEWPLGRGSGKSDAGSPGGLGTEKAGNAGYSPMPRIRPGHADSGDGKGAPATGLRPARGTDRDGAIDPFDKERLGRVNGSNTDQPAEDSPKKRGCGCCVVM